MYHNFRTTIPMSIHWTVELDIKNPLNLSCEISSSHVGEYEVQNCLLGCTAV
jgi:hypothetical protein